MVYEVVEKKNAVNLQGLRGVFLYVENESKVGNKLPRTETILWLENIWRVSGSFEQSNFFFFFHLCSWKCFKTTEMQVCPLEALNQIVVIVLWSRHEMTHQLQQYTPSKSTLGLCD